MTVNLDVSFGGIRHGGSVPLEFVQTGRSLGASKRQEIRQAVNNDQRLFRGVGGVTSGPWPPAGKRLAPPESVEWPAETYSLEPSFAPSQIHESRTVPVGTWRVEKGKVALAGVFFPSFRAPLLDSMCPFGDKDFTPWPDSNHEVCKVGGQKASGEDVSLSGNDVPMRRPKPTILAQWSEDYFILFQIGFWCTSFASLGYVPRPGRGRRPKGEADFLAAWLHEHEGKGWPRTWLERATERRQQSVSQLLARHRNNNRVESEPWASRRKSRGSTSIFHPNYSTDPKPPRCFYGGKDVLIVEERSTRVRSAPDTPDTDAHGAGLPHPARASLLEELSATSAHVSRRVIPRRRPNVRPIIDHRAATASEDR